MNELRLEDLQEVNGGKKHSAAVTAAGVTAGAIIMGLGPVAWAAGGLAYGAGAIATGAGIIQVFN